MLSSQPNTILDREGPITIRRMNFEDVGELATRLSPSDLRELEYLGISAKEALTDGYKLGSFVGCVNGEVEAAFGVNKKVYPAAIWLLGSTRARRHVRALMALSHRWIQMFNTNLAVANIVPETNATTIRWLKALDFEFEDTVYNVNGYAFLRFYRGPLTTSLPH